MDKQMIKRLLIANRGEIACRVIKTAQKMGIHTIAVYSIADRGAQHVKLADEAWLIGDAPAKESYLNIDKIIDVAVQSSANAIHPGYGFLSENADFAKACYDNNIIFVGPPVRAIELMGSKSQAKNIMQEADVPLVAGYHGEDQSEDRLKAEADKIGYPVLIKATAGGGGKGMRIVETAKDFLSSLQSCQREAKSSFGDDKVLVEKYLTKPRHIEIQVFADSHDNQVFLFERDCSVQRRHQKIIEEAPAPKLDEQTRKSMGQVAINAAKAIGYQGAGTVEFLYDEDGSFYFMEMNTRLQVEHPVTEMITGQDLVEWQIIVANGLPLPLKQEQITLNGHAFEVRIYAEDPNNSFLPATGQIEYYQTPETSEHVRVDSGIVSGDKISVYYDPMIAKLIVWDNDRQKALGRLKQALTKFNIAGIPTNIAFLYQLADHQAFINEEVETHFLDKYLDDLIDDDDSPDTDILAAATLYIMQERKHNTNSDSQDIYSPWNDSTGWRLNEDNYHLLELHETQNIHKVVAHYRDDGYLLEIDGKEIYVQGVVNSHQIILSLDGHQTTLAFHASDNKIVIFKDAISREFTIINQEGNAIDDAEQANLTAPMPGSVVSVMVKAGDQVSQGQTLIVIEAMKMEHAIKAHKDLTIEEVLYQVSDLVDEGAELIKVSES
ncbi:MAG: acetyl/propionyl/methylcrotonyl-CoA carboxylase subunit alpha [Gammaproteobacteria bacterium]|nr:acetyl/propionyl/methylcrotonyl-CoA carboxylase subunit alpha [Gammaproteobacteria bacterium]